MHQTTTRDPVTKHTRCDLCQTDLGVNWSRKVYVGIVYPNVPTERRSFEDLTLVEVKDIVVNGSLLGKPVLTEHIGYAENIAFGQVIHAELDDRNNLLAHFTVDSNDQISQDVHEQINLGLRTGLSLSHSAITKQPREISLCLIPVRKGSHVINCSRSSISELSNPNNNNSNANNIFPNIILPLATFEKCRAEMSATAATPKATPTPTSTVTAPPPPPPTVPTPTQMPNVAVESKTDAPIIPVKFVDDTPVQSPLKRTNEEAPVEQPPTKRMRTEEPPAPSKDDNKEDLQLMSTPFMAADAVLRSNLSKQDRMALASTLLDAGNNMKQKDAEIERLKSEHKRMTDERAQEERAKSRKRYEDIFADLNSQLQQLGPDVQGRADVQGYMSKMMQYGQRNDMSDNMPTDVVVCCSSLGRVLREETVRKAEQQTRARVMQEMKKPSDDQQEEQLRFKIEQARRETVPRLPVDKPMQFTMGQHPGTTYDYNRSKNAPTPMVPEIKGGQDVFVNASSMQLKGANQDTATDFVCKWVSEGQASLLNKKVWVDRAGDTVQWDRRTQSASSSSGRH